LGHLSAVPHPAKIGRKKLAKVHGPNQSTCGLFTHGFKASKCVARPQDGDHSLIRLSIISLSGLLLVAFGANPAFAQAASKRDPGRAYQRMSQFKTYAGCLSHNLRLHGDQRRASRWCSRQGYTQ
jgi:hypothetical protein